MKSILGIDPGLSGALTLYRKEPLLVSVYDMPTLEITVNGKKRRVIDLYQLAHFFDVNATLISTAVIEDPRSRPDDGAIQAFKFGHGCGVVQAMTAAHFIPMRLISPNKWKTAMGLNSDKDASRLKASQAWPTFAHLWSRKKDDGRAESALLALYGERTA